MEKRHTCSFLFFYTADAFLPKIYKDCKDKSTVNDKAPVLLRRFKFISKK